MAPHMLRLMVVQVVHSVGDSYIALNPTESAPPKTAHNRSIGSYRLAHILPFFQAADLIQLLSMREQERRPQVRVFPAIPPAPWPGSQERFWDRGHDQARWTFHLPKIFHCGLQISVFLLHWCCED